MKGKGKHFQSDAMYHGRIAVAFGYPEYGWTQLALLSTAYLESVVILCSWVYDPLPALLQWLERVVAGTFPAEFVVNEEGRSKRLVASVAREPAQLLFHVFDDERTVLLRGVFVRREFVREWADSLQRWLATAYDPYKYNNTLPEDFEEFRRFDHRTMDLAPLLARVADG